MVFYTTDISKLLNASPCFSVIPVQHFWNSINSRDYSSVYYLQLPVAKGWEKRKSKAAFIQKQHTPFSTKLMESTDGNLRTVIHTLASTCLRVSRDTGIRFGPQSHVHWKVVIPLDLQPCSSQPSPYSYGIVTYWFSIANFRGKGVSSGLPSQILLSYRQVPKMLVLPPVFHWFLYTFKPGWFL